MNTTENTTTAVNEMERLIERQFEELKNLDQEQIEIFKRRLVDSKRLLEIQKQKGNIIHSIFESIECRKNMLEHFDNSNNTTEEVNQ